MYDVSAGLQEFLICIEMFLAALAHAYAFPPRDYFDPNHQPPHGFWRSIRIMFDVRDVADDVRAVLDDTVWLKMSVFLGFSYLDCGCTRSGDVHAVLDLGCSRNFQG